MKGTFMIKLYSPFLENKCSDICQAGSGAQLSICPCVSADTPILSKLIELDKYAKRESNFN